MARISEHCLCPLVMMRRLSKSPKLFRCKYIICLSNKPIPIIFVILSCQDRISRFEYRGVLVGKMQNLIFTIRAIFLVVCLVDCLKSKYPICSSRNSRQFHPSISKFHSVWDKRVGATISTIRLKVGVEGDLYQSLSRSGLQELAKSNGIKANLKSSEIILQLKVQ